GQARGEPGRQEREHAGLARLHPGGAQGAREPGEAAMEEVVQHLRGRARREEGIPHERARPGLLRVETGDDVAEVVDQLVEGVEQVPVPRLGFGEAHGCRSTGARTNTTAVTTHTSARPRQTAAAAPDTPKWGMRSALATAVTAVPAHWNISSRPGCRIATMAK